VSKMTLTRMRTTKDETDEGKDRTGMEEILETQVEVQVQEEVVGAPPQLMQIQAKIRKGDQFTLSQIIRDKVG